MSSTSSLVDGVMSSLSPHMSTMDAPSRRVKNIRCYLVVATSLLRWSTSMSQKVRTSSIGCNGRIRTFWVALDGLGWRLVPLIGCWKKVECAAKWHRLHGGWHYLFWLLRRPETTKVARQHTIGKLRSCSSIWLLWYN